MPILDKASVEQAFSKWIEPAPQVVTPKKETARIDIEHPDTCPSCSKVMRTSIANGIPVFLCDEDRVVLPRPL